jgi:Starch-binding associating with outer membrane
MKKVIKYSIFFFVALLVLSACEKSFDDVANENPNQATSVPPSLLFNNIEYKMYDPPYASDYPLDEKWCQYFLANYDYYGNNRYDFGSVSDYNNMPNIKDFYSTLKNEVQMEKEALRIGLPAVNPYNAIGKFFKAYFFTLMSLEMGDIPMTQALKGSANLTPVYDSQKSVFQQAFVWLDSANIELAALKAKGDVSLQSDMYLGNDLGKWQKVVNTFELRLLIHLSKRADDNADLQVKERFAKILGDKTTYPIMESAADNIQFNYIYPTNIYPNNPGSFGFDALRVNCSDTYVGLLTSLKDPRVYITTEPALKLVDSLKIDSTDFRAFVGANPGEDLGAMYIKANSGLYSLLNRYRYYRTYTGEPNLIIGYPEMCFNIAEAINRGWVPSMTATDAENYYIAGIKASRAFYGIPDAGNMAIYFFKGGASLSDANPYNQYTVNTDFNTYYNQVAVKYSGNNSTGLTQILQQRYLALFRHCGLESYYTYRRTGVPVFETGPGTGNSGRIALRFQYPSADKSANTKNWQDALDKQFNGNDDINGIMWLIK